MLLCGLENRALLPEYRSFWLENRALCMPGVGRKNTNHFDMLLCALENRALFC